jgi:hypothetical protein
MNPDEKSGAVDVTAEVGDEGGTHGELEVVRKEIPATGSEAGETWRPVDEKTETVARDETGEGKRSP